MNENDVYIGTYIGKDACGFKHGEDYIFLFTKSVYCYTLYCYEGDKTIGINYSSLISVFQFWEKIQEIYLEE